MQQNWSYNAHNSQANCCNYKKSKVKIDFRKSQGVIIIRGGKRIQHQMIINLLIHRSSPYLNLTFSFGI